MTVQRIANFAWQHMKAATLFRDKVRELEITHASDGMGPHYEIVRSYASGCLMSTAAALEALINELFIDPHCSLRPKFSDFDRQFWGRGGLEMKPILDKYQEALRLLGLPPLDETRTLFQDAEALIGLRNSLVHYKPTWDADQPKKATLTMYLAGKYPLSPLLTGKNDFVSMESMSHGCCKWAVDTAFAFIRDFDARTTLNPSKMEGFWILERDFPG